MSHTAYLRALRYLARKIEQRHEEVLRDGLPSDKRDGAIEELMRMHRWITIEMGYAQQSEGIDR